MKGNNNIPKGWANKPKQNKEWGKSQSSLGNETNSVQNNDNNQIQENNAQILNAADNYKSANENYNNDGIIPENEPINNYEYENSENMDVQSNNYNQENNSYNEPQYNPNGNFQENNSYNEPQYNPNYNFQENNNSSNGSFINNDENYNNNLGNVYENDGRNGNNWAENKKSRKNSNIVSGVSKHRSFKEKIDKFGRTKFIVIILSICAILIISVTMLVLTFGFHIWGNHKWVEATCLEPKTCSGCHKTEGEPLGHDWAAATCETPMTCRRCGLESGSANGHKWIEATCESPKTCSVCHATEGTAIGHNWVNEDCKKPLKCSICGEEKENVGKHTWEKATCDKPKTCSVCGMTSGKALGHDWKEATCQDPKTCERCGKTEGKVGTHVYKEATLNEAKTCIYCGRTEGSKLDYYSLGLGIIITDEASGLNLRAEPNKDSEKVTFMSETAPVMVYECPNKGWYYVEYDGQYGYAKSDYITLIPDTNYSYYSSLSLSKVISVNLDNDKAFETIAFYGSGSSASMVIYDRGKSNSKYQYDGYGLSYHLMKDDNTGKVYWGREGNYDGSNNRSLERVFPSYSDVISYGLTTSKSTENDYNNYLSHVTFIDEIVSAGDSYNYGHWLDYTFTVN